MLRSAAATTGFSAAISAAKRSGVSCRGPSEGALPCGIVASAISKASPQCESGG